MMPKAERLKCALIDINLLIDANWEFPDACSVAATNWRVDYDELRTAYDNQWEK